jgi:hypothetical protein
MILLDIVRARALFEPARVPYNYPDDPMTYREIWNVSELLGAHLIERTQSGELKPHTPILTYGSSHPLALCCLLACAKSAHPCLLVTLTPNTQLTDTGADATVLIAAPLLCASRLPKTANIPTIANAKAVSPDAKAVSSRALDAQRIRGFIVPGMADDDICNCGQQDCEHGPFLQQCMPSSWLSDEDAFSLSHDPAQTQNMADKYSDATIISAQIDKQVLTAGKAEIAPNWWFHPADIAAPAAFEFSYLHSGG